MPEIIIMGIGDNSPKVTLPMTATKEEIVEALLATCGHEDSLGYLTNNPCGKCARKNHKKAVGGK
jgi:hypothetical protein